MCTHSDLHTQTRAQWGEGDGSGGRGSAGKQRIAQHGFLINHNFLQNGEAHHLYIYIHFNFNFFNTASRSSGCDEAVVTTRLAAWPKLALHVTRRDSQGKSDRHSRQADRRTGKHNYRLRTSLMLKNSGASSAFHDLIAGSPVCSLPPL